MMCYAYPGQTRASDYVKWIEWYYITTHHDLVMKSTFSNEYQEYSHIISNIKRNKKIWRMETNKICDSTESSTIYFLHKIQTVESLYGNSFKM